MKDNKKNIVMIGVILIIVVSILAITMLKEDDSELLDPETIECISNRSVLYISKTCSHCARQKEVLSACLDQFEVVDCTSEGERCREEGITQVPTWVIHGKHYTGVKTIDQLIEIHQNECGVCAE
ncbi:MAG: hypothetical protein JSW73_05325 [Candidatus Woesearchaeota archaeon]|nr:MAG: hypothetical protein JSW73_05325 [Candidatus Woesearchaeota archaeon]